jgi:hypothetical protein
LEGNFLSLVCLRFAVDFVILLGFITLGAAVTQWWILAVMRGENRQLYSVGDGERATSMMVMM